MKKIVMNAILEHLSLAIMEIESEMENNKEFGLDGEQVTLLRDKIGLALLYAEIIWKK